MDSTIVAAFIGAGSGAAAGQLASFVYQAYQRSTRESKMLATQKEITKLAAERKEHTTDDSKIFHRFHATCIREQFISALYSNPTNPIMLVGISFLAYIAILLFSHNEIGSGWFFIVLCILLIGLLVTVGWARSSLRKRLTAGSKKSMPTKMMRAMTTVKLTESEIESLRDFLCVEEPKKREGMGGDEQTRSRENSSTQGTACVGRAQNGDVSKSEAKNGIEAGTTPDESDGVEAPVDR